MRNSPLKRVPPSIAWCVIYLIATDRAQDGRGRELSSSEDCIFCRIVGGEAPASVAYRDDKVMAFMDLNPVTNGHLLVIPTDHAELVAEMDPAIGAHLFKKTMELVPAVWKATDCEVVNLYLADGRAAGQTVFHVHMHIIPRNAGDGLGYRYPATSEADRTELDEMASAVSAALTSGG